MSYFETYWHSSVKSWTYNKKVDVKKVLKFIFDKKIFSQLNLKIKDNSTCFHHIYNWYGFWVSKI